MIPKIIQQTILANGYDIFDWKTSKASMEDKLLIDDGKDLIIYKKNSKWSELNEH